MRLSGLLTRRRRGADDAGFSMIEVVVAIMIIGIVMTAAAGFFINSLRATGGASQRQQAVALVDKQLGFAQGVPFNQLVTGRTQAAVTTLLATSGATALTANDDTDNSPVLDYDPSATAASTPTIPTTLLPKPVVNSTTYTIRTFVDPCWLHVPTGQAAASTQGLTCNGSSNAVAGTTLSQLYRITVAAAWTGGANSFCTGGCSYSASTLADNNPDQKFNSNISQPTLSSSPASPGSLGAGATTTVTLSGSGFISGAQVVISCGDCTVGTIDQTTNTGTQIQVPITAGSTPGTYTITLINPDGGRTTQTGNFVVSPDPSGLTASPSTVRNYTTTTVAVTGSNIVNATLSGSGGTWGATSSGSTASAPFTPNGSILGSAPITVTNADLGQGTAAFTIARSAPTLTTTIVGPFVNGVSSAVTLSGTDFGPTGSVGVTATGGTVTNVTSSTTASGSGESVSFTYTPDGRATGTNAASFQVVNADGGQTGTVAGTITRSVPRITGLTPTSVTRGTTPTFVVTVSGITTATAPTLVFSSNGVPVYSGAATVTSPNTVAFAFYINPVLYFPGIYLTSLQLTDNDGGTASYTTVVTVH